MSGKSILHDKRMIVMWFGEGLNLAAKVEHKTN